MTMKRTWFALTALIIALLACDEGAPPTPFPTLETSKLDNRATAYGFFPSPPEATLESVLGHYQSMSEHADFVLFQHSIPWERTRASASSVQLRFRLSDIAVTIWSCITSMPSPAQEQCIAGIPQPN